MQFLFRIRRCNYRLPLQNRCELAVKEWMATDIQVPTVLREIRPSGQGVGMWFGI